MRKSVLIFLFILTPSLGAMHDDDHDKPLFNRNRMEHLSAEDDYEMSEYSGNSDDAPYQERNLYANEFTALHRKIHTLSLMQHNTFISLVGAQCATSGIFFCGAVLACAYMIQGTSDKISESTNYITQRIDNLAAQCSCPQMPTFTTQPFNTTDNTTANPFSTPTDTAFLNMISGNMSTNQTTLREPSAFTTASSDTQGDRD